jgi:hypothetical protein
VKRIIRIALGGLLVCLVIAVGQSLLAQGGPNEQCPQLRTDVFGFPLIPPYSEYVPPNNPDSTTTTEVIQVLKENLPCCIDPDGNFVPADGVLERCIVPNRQFGSPPAVTCPALVDVVLTVEGPGGVVRNCLAPFDGGPPMHGGGSNFFIIGGNGG